MTEDYEAGLFASDDLLARAQADLDAFYWQSHTMTHLARDNLGKNDCDIEDGGECTLARRRRSRCGRCHKNYCLTTDD